jgi:hypothetical protein
MTPDASRHSDGVVSGVARRFGLARRRPTVPSSQSTFAISRSSYSAQSCALLTQTGMHSGLLGDVQVPALGSPLVCKAKRFPQTFIIWSDLHLFWHCLRLLHMGCKDMLDCTKSRTCYNESGITSYPTCVSCTNMYFGLAAGPNLNNFTRFLHLVLSKTKIAKQLRLAHLSAQ